jgi:hypothetical protein
LSYDEIVTHSRWPLPTNLKLFVVSDNEKIKSGFCIYINTFCEGSVPIERDETNFPVVYSTLIEAQREIVEYTIERLEQFLVGERDFGDATTIEEYIVEVDVFSDGSILDESGQWFGSDW